jgi:hypothetical protein
VVIIIVVVVVVVVVGSGSSSNNNNRMHANSAVLKFLYSPCRKTNSDYQYP